MSALGSDLRWYVLWTRSRHEAVVRQELERVQIEAFLPMVTKWSRWNDRKKQIEWPLFPGYCFARFAPEARRTVLKRTGVASIVSFSGTPAPFPDTEIDGLRRLVETELRYDPCPLVKEGTMVEVTHGPLRGVVGRLVRKRPQARVVLSVDLIGQGVSVEVDASDIRPR